MDNTRAEAESKRQKPSSILNNMKCKTKYCRREAYEPSSSHYYCPRCISKRFRERKPFQYYFNVLRCNARRRGKIFTIGINDFIQLWQSIPDAWSNRGRRADAWSIDRIKNGRGYERGNIRLLRYGENSMKNIPFWQKNEYAKRNCFNNINCPLVYNSSICICFERPWWRLLNHE